MLAGLRSKKELLLVEGGNFNHAIKIEFSARPRLFSSEVSKSERNKQFVIFALNVKVLENYFKNEEMFPL